MSYGGEKRETRPTQIGLGYRYAAALWSMWGIKESVQDGLKNGQFWRGTHGYATYTRDGPSPLQRYIGATLDGLSTHECGLADISQYFQFKETPESLVSKGFQGLTSLTPGSKL